MFIPTPNSTTINGAGMIESRNGLIFPQETSNRIESNPITAAPMCKSVNVPNSSLKVFSWSGWMKDISPSGSVS